MAVYFEQQVEQKKEMRWLVETITLGHQNVKETKQRLQEMKQQIGKGREALDGMAIMTCPVHILQ